MQKYTLTDEHRAQIEPWAQKWIAHGMSTAAMTEEDRAITREAVMGLYRAANLEPPPENRIVFVPSPFVLRFAAGFAAAIWWLRKNRQTAPAVSEDTAESTREATDAATSGAINAATNDAARRAVDGATYAATDDATRDATYKATDEATLAATSAAINAAINDATHDSTSEPVNAAAETWYAGVGNMRALARLILGEHHAMFGLQCAARAWNMWQGGNQWAAWAAFLSFFRHIVKLPIDYSKWQHWEAAAIHGGPRIMHPDFCMISDRPETLTVDDQSRPHNATGPFCQWRDGTRLYCWHGVQIPAKYYERQHTAREILDEPNAEVRRAMIERYDALRHSGAFIEDVGAKVLDSSVQRVLSNGKWAEKTAVNELLTIDLPGDPEERMVYLRVTCPSTERKYLIRVPPDQRTVRGALAWTANVPEDEYNLIAES